MRILVNIDVPDLEHAIDFYHRAFGLTLRRRLGPKAAEMLGAEAPIYLLEKAAGTPAAGAMRQPRDYARHWTPVHLDVVVEDADRAVAQAVAAGARLRSTFRPEHTWSIEQDGQRIGFYALRPEGDGLRLDHLYIRPAAQGSGLGGQVMRKILLEADRLGLAVSLGALRGSDSNRFYRRHGFVQTGESEWDIDYLRPVSGRAG